MSASPATQQLIGGKPRVKPGNIENELEKIRSSAAQQDAAKEQAEKGSSSPRARATLSNLIIVNCGSSFAEATDLAEKTINQLIDGLCVSYPSRFFIVDAKLPNAADPNGIATAVSSRCFLADSGAHVCSEEIYISVDEKGAGLVKNLLVSLLAPDVDVVLLIVGDLCDSTGSQALGSMLSAICPLVDRIVYDSNELLEYGRGVSLLANLGAKVDASVLGYEKLSDINWKRTRRWRALVAEGFDAEYWSDPARKLSRISLSYVGGDKDSAPCAEALLVASWIISSLGLTPDILSASKVESTYGLHCRGNGVAPQIEFTSIPSDKLHEGLLVLEVTADTPDSISRLRIERFPDRDSAEISTGVTDLSDSAKLGTTPGCEFVGRRLPFLPSSFEDLVLSHVVSRRDDPHYIAALKISTDISSAFAKVS